MEQVWAWQLSFATVLICVCALICGVERYFVALTCICALICGGERYFVALITSLLCVTEVDQTPCVRLLLTSRVLQ